MQDVVMQFPLPGTCQAGLILVENPVSYRACQVQLHEWKAVSASEQRKYMFKQNCNLGPNMLERVCQALPLKEELWVFFRPEPPCAKIVLGSIFLEEDCQRLRSRAFLTWPAGGALLPDDAHVVQFLVGGPGAMRAPCAEFQHLSPMHGRRPQCAIGCSFGYGTVSAPLSPNVSSVDGKVSWLDRS